jgi:phosphatidylserine/phosphatidylglycerophosphate/cardiolipin synthase-like enzyme
MKPLFAVVSLLALVVAAPGCTRDEGAGTAESDFTATTDKPYEGTCTPGARICAFFAPTDMPAHAVIGAMKSAQRSIRIATYNINIPEIADVLRRRLDEGVKVELMEDFAHAVGDEPDAGSVWMRLGEHPNLTKYKTPVLRGGNPQMHDKILVVDDERVFFGSANWTFTGLVGNFENVMAVRDPATVAKFVAELDELKALSQLVCETFGTPVSSCGKGTERLSPEFHHLALEGSFEAAPAGPIDKTQPGCGVLLDGSGLFIAGNQPRIADPAALKACFVDPALGDKYATFAARAASLEKYADGTRVKEEPPLIETITPASGRAFDAVTFKHRDRQSGPIRAYFGGEDDVEHQMLRELRAAEENPSEAFAYLSTNFLTNSRLVKEVVKLNELGVRTRVFFDRGRFEDPNFHSQFYLLSKLGFTYGLGSNRVTVEPGASGRWKITRLAELETEDSLARSVVSVFDNDLSGNFGANHNKFAVIGHKGADGRFRVSLMNGSANWSGGAMQENDENFVVLEDEHAASLYLREMISQMHGFRYAQDENSRGLQEDMAFVAARVPCFDAAMGRPSDACKGDGDAPWRPAVSGALIVAVKDVPAPLDGSRRVWAWVANWQAPTGGAAPGRAFELFSSDTFEGKWVTSIPYAPGSELQYKFFTAPPGVDPNRDGAAAPGIAWEYDGVGNDRRATLGSRPLLTIRSSNLQWGSP